MGDVGEKNTESAVKIVGTTLTWQIPSAILVVDSVVIGFIFSKDTSLPSWMSAALLVVGGVFSLILTFNFWKYVCRSSRRLERIKETEKQHSELRRFSAKEQWYGQIPLGLITTAFLIAVNVGLLVLAGYVMGVWLLG